MPLVTPQDVAEGFRTRWAAVPALEAAVPSARVYRDRVAESIDRPNARLIVTETKRERFSDLSHVQWFDVRVEAYLLADTDDVTVRRLIDGAFNGTKTAPSAGLTISNAVRVTSCFGAGGDPTLTNERVDGLDIVKVEAKFMVVLQSSRS